MTLQEQSRIRVSRARSQQIEAFQLAGVRCSHQLVERHRVQRRRDAQLVLQLRLECRSRGGRIR